MLRNLRSSSRFPLFQMPRAELYAAPGQKMIRRYSVVPSQKSGVSHMGNTPGVGLAWREMILTIHFGGN
jgi:hypothetical protein